MPFVAWLARHQLLTLAGWLLVAEDSVVPVEVIAVSNSTSMPDLLEAAHLYREGIAPAIVFPTAAPEPYAEELSRLGTPRLLPAEYATWILELAGVPRTAVHALSTITDGTETGIAAVATYARKARPPALMYVTARNHTTRARALLRRELPAGTTIVMHSPRTDTFAPESWWYSRAASREVAMEYLRWVNTFVLHDLWANQPAPPTVAQAPAEK